MSKAILVMDMPKSCDGCLLHGTMIGKQICNAEIKRVKDESVKPDWCPLKPMPEKKKERYGMNRQTSTGHWETYGEKIDSVAVGYNACIDAILGDKE